jgi:UDP-N-acetylglucosamine:LPS N-acetylglucosamine transferase
MKLLLVCTTGGHFSTMMGLKKFWSVHQREWVTHVRADTEQLRGQEHVYWIQRQESRDLWRAGINFFRALSILRKSRPDLVLSTGAGVAVPFVLASKLLGIKTVFVESISRSTDLSMTGKLVYNLVDEFYVQWPECTKNYPKAQYKGIVQ